MKFLFAVLLLATPAHASLIDFTTGDLSGGATSIHTNVNGLGIDFEYSFSSSIVGDTVLIDNAGFIAPNQFGWEFTQVSGFAHTGTTTFRIDALNGTFDGRIGLEKLVGSGLDELSFRSDGTFSNINPGYTLVGDTLQVSDGFLAFTSSDPGNTFTPDIAGASFIEFSRGPSFVAFGGSGDQNFDFNLTSADVASVPEPGTFVAFLATAAYVLRRRRNGQ